MSSSPIIRVRNLTKSYAIAHTDTRATSLKEAIAARRLRGGGSRHTTERFMALNDVSFDVQPGERLGIIGANGAGKSTLLKIICQVTLPESGSVELRGSVGSLLEVGTGFHPDLTGRENVFLNGAILGLTRRDIARRFEEIVEFAGVERFLDTPVKRYSSGMHVRLGFAVAAHLEPDVLIVDEVLAVGDAAFQRKCLGKLEELASNEGRTVVFVSHSQSAVQELCSRVVLLESGRVAFDGSMKEGVLRYLDLQEDQDTSTGEWDLSHRSNGHDPTGTAMLTCLVVEHAGTRSAITTRGESTRISIVAEHLPPLLDVWVGLRLTSDLGQPLATFISPLRPDTAEAHASAVTASLDLPDLPFSPGNYRIDVGLVDMATNRVLDEVRGAGVLSLRHPELGTEAYRSRFGDGLVAVPGEWSVESA